MSDPHARPALPGEFWVFLGAVLWSTGGVAVKMLDLPELTIAGGRSLIAALFFALLIKGRILPLEKPAIVIKGSIAYCAVVTLYVIATKWTTAANAIIFQYTAPLWIAALSWPMLGERPARRDLVALVFGAVGVLICLSDKFRISFADGITRAMAGDLIGLASGVAFALLVLILRDTAKFEAAVARRVNWQILVWGNLLAAAVGAPAVAGSVSAGSFTVLAVIALLYLGVGQLGTGYLAFQHGLRTTPALRASIISLAEPVLNPVWVAIFAGEKPSVNAIVGGSLVLAVLLVNALVPKRAPRL